MSVSLLLKKNESRRFYGEERRGSRVHCNRGPAAVARPRGLHRPRRSVHPTPPAGPSTTCTIPRPQSQVTSAHAKNPGWDAMVAPPHLHQLDRLQYNPLRNLVEWVQVSAQSAGEYDRLLREDREAAAEHSGGSVQCYWTSALHPGRDTLLTCGGQSTVRVRPGRLHRSSMPRRPARPAERARRSASTCRHLMEGP